MCSATARELAPPLLATEHAGAPRGIQIHLVVACTEQLHQPQPRRGTVERIVHALDIPKQIVRLGQRGGIARAAGRSDRKLEPGGRHLPRLIGLFRQWC